MKKILFLFVLALSGHICLAQSMRGYVKTKGRMVNGKVIRGTGLSGVNIRVRGNNVVLSGKDGSFFISFPHKNIGDSIYIELISRPGFELIDKDILNRPIIYNPNTPLTIVMEEEYILAEERLAIEKKLRRTLLLQLGKAEKEIQELDISIEEKNRKLQELYNKQSNQERLINNMVNQYGKYDYDAMSIFDLKVTECIINGELEKADSLLNTKGNISERVKKLNEIKERISQSDSIIQSEGTRLAIVADSLHQLGRELLNNGQIAEGREFTRQAMEMRKKLLGEVSEDYIASLNNYALTFGMEKDYAKAVELQEQVMKLCGKLKTPHKNIGMYTTNMGRFYYLAGDKAKAAKTWEQALPLVDKYGEIYEFLLNSLGSVYDDLGDQQGISRIMALIEQHNQHEISKPCDEPKCMLERAQYYGTMSNLEKANEYYQKAIYMKMDDEMKVMVYEEYAHFLAMTANDSQTGAEYQRQAAMLRKETKGENADYAKSIYSAGLYYTLDMTKDGFQKAINCLDLSKQAFEKLNDAQMVAKCQQMEGNAYGGLKEFGKAKDCYAKALAYYEANDKESDEYPKMIERVASMEKLNKEYEVSIEHYRQAMTLFKQRGMMQEYGNAENGLKLCYAYAESNYLSFDTSTKRNYLLKIAEIENGNYEKTKSIASRFLDELSDDENALKYFNSALKIAVDRSSGLGSPDIASIHQNIGMVYNFQGNFTKAIEEYNCALSLQRELMGDSTRHVGQSLMLIGITYNSMKKYDLALEYYKEALGIYENIFKHKKSSDIANIYNNMGVAYENEKDNKQALHYYEMALNIRKELYDDDEHPDIAYSYSNIAGVYDYMEDYDKAIAYYQKSIDVLKKSKGNQHQDVGLMYNNIAATYYNMDELETSLSNFNQALEIMKIFLPEDHPNIRAIIENIEIVKNEIKRN